MTRVLVKIVINIADHDGYCSDSECQLRTEKVKLKINICDFPILRKYLQDGGDINDFKWNYDEYFPSLNKQIKSYGSGYCSLSRECSQLYLKVHSYDVASIKAKVI